MPAYVKVFLDKECTKELLRADEGAFFFRFRKNDKEKTTYLDGTNGESGTTSLFLKNIGSSAALNIKVSLERKEAGNIFSISSAAFKEIAKDDVKEVKFDYIVAPWTEAQINQTFLYLDYYSLPDTAPEYIPYNRSHVSQNETYYGPTVESTANDMQADNFAPIQTKKAKENSEEE